MLFSPCFLLLTHSSKSGCSDRSPALDFDTFPISYANAQQALPEARAGVQPLLYSEPQFILHGLREHLLPYAEKGAQSVFV